jgi:hypothetical protein
MHRLHVMMRADCEEELTMLCCCLRTDAGLVERNEDGASFSASPLALAHVHHVIADCAKQRCSSEQAAVTCLSCTVIA